MVYNKLQKGVKANFLKRCLVRPFIMLVASVSEKLKQKTPITRSEMETELVFKLLNQAILQSRNLMTT